MLGSASRFTPPRSHDDWRALALGLAEFSCEAVPAGEQAAFDQMKDIAWDVATRAAFWRTVQLPSLGPGLLPWTVLGLVMIGQVITGRMAGPWPSLSDPFLLWPSLWLIGWFGLTLVLAAIRHGRAKRQALQIGARLGLFSSSAKSA